MSSVYDTDILLWAEQQAALLRRVAAGERPNELDWENLIDEVESVGRSQLQAVERLLEVALRYLLLAYGTPDPEPVPHWLVEASAAIRQARKRASPSMIARLDLPEIWLDALDYAGGKLSAQGGAARPLPAVSPFSTEQLLRSTATAPDLLIFLTETSASQTRSVDPGPPHA